MNKKYIIIKNVLDFILSLFALIVLFPFFCIFAIISSFSIGNVVYPIKSILKNDKNENYISKNIVENTKNAINDEILQTVKKPSIIPPLLFKSRVFYGRLHNFM